MLSVLLADEGDCDYTVAELAERGPEGRDAIRGALRKLEAAGYIVRRQTHDGQGRFGDNEYLIYEAPLPGNPSTVEPSPEKPLTENPATVGETAELDKNKEVSTSEKDCPVSLRENKEVLLKPPTNSPRKKAGPKAAPDWKPERFAAFWKFYPRGESKQAAIAAWDKLRPDDGLIDLMARALVRQMHKPDWQRGIGIPYASTWLNQRRWEDDIKPVAAQASGYEPGLDEAPDVVDWTARGA